MAGEFDVPAGTIKRRLHVARQRLKEVMEGTRPGPRRAAASWRACDADVT